MLSVKTRSVQHEPRLRCVYGVWAESYWTDKGVREVKWPKDFSSSERKLIRMIAKVALENSQK